MYGIPRRYQEAQDARACASVWKGAVEQYLSDMSRRVRKGEGLILSGSNGCGKTWTTCAIAQTLDRESGRKFEYVFVNSAELVSTLYPLKHSQYVEHWGSTFDEMVEECSLLIIDDLGHEIRQGGMSPIVTQKLSRLLRKRMDKCKLTFVTTNLALEPGEDINSIESEFGSAVASIIDDLCPYRFDAGPKAPDLRAEKVKKSTSKDPKA